MLCDLVGSTSLAVRLDAEDWRNLANTYLDEASAAVTVLSGHVLKRLGDGLMALLAFRGRRRTMPSARCSIRSPNGRLRFGGSDVGRRNGSPNSSRSSRRSSSIGASTRRCARARHPPHRGAHVMALARHAASRQTGNDLALEDQHQNDERRGDDHGRGHDGPPRDFVRRGARK